MIRSGVSVPKLAIMFFILFAMITASAALFSLRRALNFLITVMLLVRSLLASFSSPKVIQGCCSSCAAVHRLDWSTQSIIWIRLIACEERKVTSENRLVSEACGQQNCAKSKQLLVEKSQLQQLCGKKHSGTNKHSSIVQ